MAAVRAGVLPASCLDCQSNPAEKEYWGCGKEGLVEWEDIHTGNRFKTCPIQFVRSNIYQFVEEVDYMKRYPSTAKSYRKNTRRFLDGMYFYEAALATNMKAARGNHE